MTQITVFSPVAPTQVKSLPLAKRGGAEKIRRLAWFDNSKANAASLLAHCALLLNAKGVQVDTIEASKNATAAAPTDVVAYLETCDAVVLAIAD